MGWRITATRPPSFFRIAATRRGVWLFPAPGRAAQMRTTGRGEAGQRRGVDTALDVRDLRGGEADDLILGARAEEDVEVVEIASSGTEDKDAANGSGPPAPP